MTELKKRNRAQNADQRLDLRQELDNLEKQLADLKIQYEQHFCGILPLAPEKQHAAVKRQIRMLMKAPFKSSAMTFRLKVLENRYQAFNTYWARVMKQKEEGTYSKDIYKAALRERFSAEDEIAETRKGGAEKNFNDLFNTYKSALEKQTGRKQNVDYSSFKKALVSRAQSFKAQHGHGKLSFRVTVKDGKVTVQARAKA